MRAPHTHTCSHTHVHTQTHVHVLTHILLLRVYLWGASVHRAPTGQQTLPAVKMLVPGSDCFWVWVCGGAMPQTGSTPPRALGARNVFWSSAQPDC